MNLSERIVQLNENAYVLDNYILQINAFYGEVFYSKYYLDKINPIDRNKCIIDAGAYIGDSALFLAEYTDNKVFAFEPISETYSLVEKTVSLNNIANKIFPVKKGLSDKKGIFYINVTDVINNSTLVNYDIVDKSTTIIKQEEIEVTTIDDFVKAHNLQISLIKSDIEGAEQDFIKGGINTIKSQAPAMLLSIYHSADDFFNIKPMIEDIMKDSEYYYEFDFHQMLYPHGALVDCMLICKPHKK